MTHLLLALLAILALILFSPLLAGLEQWFGARLQGRPRSLGFLFQPYRDLRKLWRIKPIRPESASWFFAAVPVLLLGINGLLLLALPAGVPNAFLSLSLILLVYLLALHRFLLSLAGLEGDMPFSGLGGARTLFFNFITEINFLLWIAALGLYWRAQPADTSHDGLYLDAMIQAHQALGWGILARAPLLLLGIVLGLLIIYELERIPVGDPTSHLELTMGEKALTLAWQGRDLALIKTADMWRLSFFMALWALLFLPMDWPGSLPQPMPGVVIYLLFLIKIIFVTLVMTVITNTRAKLRLGRVAGPAFFAGALSLLSIVLTISVP